MDKRDAPMNELALKYGVQPQPEAQPASYMEDGATCPLKVL